MCISIHKKITRCSELKMLWNLLFLVLIVSEWFLYCHIQRFIWMLFIQSVSYHLMSKSNNIEQQFCIEIPPFHYNTFCKLNWINKTSSIFEFKCLPAECVPVKTDTSIIHTLFLGRQNKIRSIKVFQQEHVLLLVIKLWIRGIRLVLLISYS